MFDLGEHDEYARLFQRAFRLQPAMMHPSPTDWPVSDGTRAAENLCARAQALVDRGVAYSPVLAALAIGEAVLGNRVAVRRLMDYDRFLRCLTVPVPGDFSGEDFHAELEAEIRMDLKYHDPQEGGVMRKSWRNDHILASGQPASCALGKEIHRRVEQYIAALPSGTDHPFVVARPHDYVIDGWALITSGPGHLIPHIHLRAWLSGVYYVRRPEPVRTSGDSGGALRLAAPDNLGIPQPGGWPVQMIEPAPGTLVLMPGYFFHSTIPTHVDEERICVAFNVYPREFAHMAKVILA
ncbi:MAG: hypothetical protein EBS05_02780 [Proteobacteria bacterium]|nr:hypothetical protein [Pseudomonadota bacterium]NDF01791.1 hypothetical protein [Verrucomicrobiota bacterium]